MKPFILILHTAMTMVLLLQQYRALEFHNYTDQQHLQRQHLHMIHRLQFHIAHYLVGYLEDLRDTEESWNLHMFPYIAIHMDMLL